MSCDWVGETSEVFEDVLDNIITEARWDQVARSQYSVIRRSRDDTLGVLFKKCVTELFFFLRRGIHHAVDLTITDPCKVHWLTV